MEQRASRLGREIGRDCLDVRLRLLNRSVTRLYDAALRPYSITIAQLNLLASVANLQPIPSGKLADLLSLEISTLSRNARLMESAGWLEISAACRARLRRASIGCTAVCFPGASRLRSVKQFARRDRELESGQVHTSPHFEPMHVETGKARDPQAKETTMMTRRKLISAISILGASVVSAK